MLRIARLVLPLLLASASGLADAQPGPGGSPAPAPVGDESRWRIGAAFGYGERSNPLFRSDDVPILVDLDIAWFGDRWFFDNGDAGITFADNAALTASIVGRFNSDRVFFSRTESGFVVLDGVDGPIEAPANIEPPDRDYAIELGVEILTDGRWGALHFTGFHDASGTHEGFELGANYSFSWRSRRLHIEPSLGFSYKSAELNDYYWGLTAEEGGGIVPAYTADAGTNWRARLTVGYQLSGKWAASLVVEYERLNDEAFMSPIVEEQGIRGVFAGLSRRF